MPSNSAIHTAGSCAICWGSGANGISRFVNASSGTPEIEFYTNRLPKQILVCIEHGPGRLVRDVLLYEMTVNDVDPSSTNIHEIADISNVTQKYTSNELADDNCTKDMQIAATEFGLSGSKELTSDVVQQYMIDEKLTSASNFTYVRFVRIENEKAFFRLMISLDQGVECAAFFGPNAFAGGQNMDHLDQHIAIKDEIYGATGLSPCSGKRDQPHSMRSNSFGAANYVDFSIDLEKLPMYLATCSTTFDPFGGRDVVTHDWFRYNKETSKVVQIEGSTPFKNNDRVYCNNTYKWKRPT